MYVYMSKYVYIFFSPGIRIALLGAALSRGSEALTCMGMEAPPRCTEAVALSRGSEALTLSRGSEALTH
jgi:hypothetical protein